MNTKIISSKIQGTSVYLLDRAGNVLASTSSGLVGKPVSSAVNGNYLVVNTDAGKTTTYELRDGCSPLYLNTR